MKNVPIYFLILFSSTTFATEWTFRPDSAHNHSISIASGYSFASNAITNEFAEAYFFHRFIDDDIKDHVSKNLKSLNRFGTDFRYELSYMKRNDTVFGLPNSFFAFTLANRYHANSEFSKDAFELYFRGNKQYAGETAELGEFTYNQIFYQQLRFTFGHNYKREGNSFEYSAGISLNKGQRYLNITAPDASIYTSPQGEYLDLDANIKFYQSDSSKTDQAAWNGTGASADFTFSWRDRKSNVLNFTMKNLGFISWNKNTSFVSADTAFRFEGVDITDLFLLTDSLHETISLDSSLVEPYLTERENKSYTSAVPAYADLSYRYIITPGKFDAEAGINYLFFAGYTLQESMTVSMMFGSDHRLSLRASYGGYTGFQAGLAYRFYFFDRWMLTLRSDYLSSMINKEKGTAQGAFVSLAAYF